MFDLQSAIQLADRSADCRSNMYIPVYDTNGRSIKHGLQGRESSSG